MMPADLRVGPPRAWQQALPDSPHDAGVDFFDAQVRGGGLEGGRDAGHAIVPPVLVHRPLEAL